MGTVYIDSYKEYQIEYDTDKKDFLAKGENAQDGIIRAPDEITLRGKIDRAIKNIQKTRCGFPLDVLLKTYAGKIYRAKITSLTSNNEIWVSWIDANKENHREKKSLRYTYGAEFYELNAKNELVVHAIEDFELEIREIENKIKQLTLSIGEPINFYQKFGIEEHQ